MIEVPQIDSGAETPERVPDVPALEIWNVTKRWPGTPAPVLQGVDLWLEHGTITWLVGSNGAGKTTLLRIAAGLLYPDEGAVFAHDLHPRRDRHDYQRTVAFLSAMNNGLYARMSVRLHLNFWASLAGMTGPQREEAVRRATADFVLEKLLDGRVDRLSMGQRQRVRLAGVFMLQPQVVLLDEPRNSLDLDGERMVDRAVERVLARGGAVLWAGPTGEKPPGLLDARYELEGAHLWQR